MHAFLAEVWKECYLSIPFIGIFALHPSNFQLVPFRNVLLSIPFIGIFALHLNIQQP
mgnify:CR=1 FL=1